VLATSGSILLQGIYPFILKIDETIYWREKVCKSFDAIAIASLLSIKVASPNLKGKK